MSVPTSADRREFLRRAAAALAAPTAASAAAAAPLYVPASSFGANDRVATAHVGVGGQGRGNLGRFLAKSDAQPVAVCDVDAGHAAEAAAMVGKAGGSVAVTADYLELLGRDDVDAFVVSTPDHWHALPTIHACESGKDVYCEKPLTLTVAEGRRMVDAARRHDRVVQTGSQQRADQKFRRACGLVRSGAVGELREVFVGIPGPNHPGEPVPDGGPPAELDYDRWLGPAPDRPYNVKRVHYNFRFFRDYSGGQITNWGAHHLDIAQWGLGTDGTGPVSVRGDGTFHPRDWHEVTETCAVEYGYADGRRIRLSQKTGDWPGGVTFVGDAGRIHVDRGRLSAEPQRLLDHAADGGGIELYESDDHVGNFLACVRSRETPICDVEIGHRSATLCHLANIAVTAGRELTWDPVAERFAADAGANALLDRPNRPPYTV